MTIYFAGAIRAGREDRAIYLAIVERLRQYGEVLTEHVGDESLAAAGEPAGDRGIHDRDLEVATKRYYPAPEHPSTRAPEHLST